MRWDFWRKADWEEAGERARRLHSAWLTEALASAKRQPRIPVRKVDEGGFTRMTGTPEGKARSERWWSLALERVDD